MTWIIETMIETIITITIALVLGVLSFSILAGLIMREVDTIRRWREQRRDHHQGRLATKEDLKREGLYTD